jgi:hypothetical protein
MVNFKENLDMHNLNTYKILNPISFQMDTTVFFLGNISLSMCILRISNFEESKQNDKDKPVEILTV